jgi:transcriptional regulator with XRE-family HTH domain
MSALEGNQYAAGNDGGRPTKYKDEYPDQAYKLCLLGHTDAELAEFFEVAESTINEWKSKHEEFSESIKKGKAIADAEVAVSLYKRATGYSHPDVHFSSYEGKVTKTDYVKQYPPDPTAAIFWLKNRQAKLWRDKQEINLSGRVQGSGLDHLTDDQLRERLTRLKKGKGNG